MPGYFEDGYFDPTSVGPAPGTEGVRDDAIFQAIVAILQATGEFDDVHYPSLPEEQGEPAAELKMAVLEPAEHSEPVEIFDDGSDEIVMAKYQLHITVRDGDAATCASEVDRLMNVACNAINGQSILGATFPDTTRLKRGKWNRRVAPEQKVICQGEFQYEVIGWTGHATT